MEEVSVIRLEGLAFWGLVRNARLEKCEEGERIIAQLQDGRTVATPCLEHDAAGRVMLVIKQYTNKWSNLIVEGASP